MSDQKSSTEIIRLLNVLLRDLSARTLFLSQWVGEGLGLGPIDYKCLDIIMRGDNSLTGIEVARATGLTSGAITGIIDRLEKLGYVYRRRDIKDRRLVFIIPNREKVETAIRPLISVLDDRMKDLYSNYKSKDLAIIADFLKKTNHAIQDTTDKLSVKVRKRQTSVPDKKENS